MASSNIFKFDKNMMYGFVLTIEVSMLSKTRVFDWIKPSEKNNFSNKKLRNCFSLMIRVLNSNEELNGHSDLVIE